MTKSVILDASAFLAVLFQEKGQDMVLKAMPYAIMSAVNETEILTKAFHRSSKQEQAQAYVDSFNVKVVPYTQAQSRLAAELYTQIKMPGISLADRACLALAIERNLPVLTGDRVWEELGIGVDVQMIR